MSSNSCTIRYLRGLRSKKIMDTITRIAKNAVSTILTQKKKFCQTGIYLNNGCTFDISNQPLKKPTNEKP